VSGDWSGVNSPRSSKEALMFVLAQNAQLIESKAQAEPANDIGRRSRAQVPFVVTKHQPSNG
jgi:hypothetical protein